MKTSRRENNQTNIEWKLGLLFHMQLFKSNISSKRTKIKLYKTLVCPVMTYGAQTWTLKTTDENSLHVFEKDYSENIWTYMYKRNWRI
jgi:hypothetical protein